MKDPQSTTDQKSPPAAGMPQPVVPTTAAGGAGVGAATGAVAGAAIGAFAGPPGMVAGALIGAAAGAATGAALADDHDAALALLPRYVAERTTPIEVREIEIP